MSAERIAAARAAEAAALAAYERADSPETRAAWVRARRDARRAVAVVRADALDAALVAVGVAA